MSVIDAGMEDGMTRYVLGGDAGSFLRARTGSASNSYRPDASNLTCPGTGIDLLGVQIWCLRTVLMRVSLSFSSRVTLLDWS